nr:hypothetical protein L204_00447 [Cryptococcus depauperatus CBS 7855]
MEPLHKRSLSGLTIIHWRILPLQSSSTAAKQPGLPLLDTVPHTTLHNSLGQDNKQASLQDPSTNTVPPSSPPSSSSSWSNEQGFLRHHQATILPDADHLRLQVVQQRHDHLTAGHLGRTKTLQLVSKDYGWPKMKPFIHHYLDTCDTCQKSRFLALDRTVNSSSVPLLSIHSRPYQWTLSNNLHLPMAMLLPW